MKKIEFNLDENPFVDMLSSRYTMTARIGVERLWKWCHENDKSFFIMSLGCLMNATNKVTQLKRRIIDDETCEFEYLEGTTPIMDDDNEVYREMRVETPQNFKNIIVWHDYVKELSKDILAGKKKGFDLDMSLRDSENIANYSCIPWVDFDSITTCIVQSNQIQPLITWGRVNENYEMSVSISVNHIFVNGRDLGYFYEYAQDEFDRW